MKSFFQQRLDDAGEYETMSDSLKQYSFGVEITTVELSEVLTDIGCNDMK